jgi:hypothetical protein
MGAPTYSLSAFNTFQPLCMVKVPSGDLLGFNGINRGFRWNGRTTAFHNVGVDAPTAAPTVAASGSGSITGAYDCYYRYADQDGNYSNLSPVASVTASSNLQFNWSAVANATNADGRIVKKQLWRTTAGQTTTLYLIGTISDNTTTTFTDTMSDATMLANAEADSTTRISVVNPNGSLAAMRFCVPPNFKAVACWFQDRLWLAVDVEYTQGTATFTNGSATVTGVGTDWVSTMAGRHIYNATAGRWYEISSVGSATSITLTENYAGTTVSGVTYTIRPDHTWRNMLVYSEANEPESMCETNVIRAQQSLSFTDDEVTGLQCHGSYMYVLKERSILRLSYVNQPQIDTAFHSAAMRGAFTNRCYDMVEDIAYMMDEFGPWRFDGSSVDDIGHRIQDYWRDGTVDFSQKKWFWVKVDPTTELVYFAVAFSGDTRPKRAFVYSYRLDSWSLVVWHQEMGGAAVYPISSRPRFLLGGIDDQVHLANQGYADGVDSTTETGTMRGTATAATSTTLTDGSATFTSTMVGSVVSIVSGTGKGQTRTITARTSTQLTVAAWTTTPDTSSVYEIGAVEWSFKGKQFQYAITDQEKKRSLRLTYQPTTNDNTLDIRRIVNADTSPVNQEIPWDQGDGVSWADDDPDMIVDLKSSRASVGGNVVNAPGFVRVEFDSNADDWTVVDRWATFHLRGYAWKDAIKIYAMDVEGAQ